MGHQDADVPGFPNVTRRKFLKGTAGVVGGAALLGSGSQFFVHAESTPPNTEEKVVPTFCRGNCFQNCRINAHVRDGKIVKTSMAPFPNAKYNRICAKGLSHVQRIYGADRIKYPMKRVGERGSGKWERISWDQAISEIVASWKSVQAKYGPQALLLASLSGNHAVVNGMFCLPRLQNALGASGLELCVDTGTKIGLDRVLGPQWDAFHTNDITDLANARTIFVWGANITEAQVHEWRFLAEAKERGATMVVIDPRFTTCAAKADRYVPVRPGSDTALALGMMRVIITEGLHNQAFMLAHTVAPFLVRQDTKRYLRQSDITGKKPAEGQPDPYMVWDASAKAAAPAESAKTPALEGSHVVNGIAVATAFELLKQKVAPFTPQKVAELTDVAPEVVPELARLYVTSSPSSIIVRFGVDRYANAHYFGHAIATLAALTGEIGKPGASVGQPLLYGWHLNFPAMAMTNGNFGPSIPLLLLEDVVKTGQFLGKPFPVKAMYIAAGNFVSNATNQRAWLDTIIPGMESIVVADMVMTDTTKYADIVLPAAHWFETTDVMVYSDHMHTQYAEAVIPPSYEAKPDMEIISLLGKGMGVGEFFKYSSEDYVKMLLDNDACKAMGLTLDALKKGPIRYLPEPYIKYADYKFASATGRMEFYSEDPKPRLDLGLPFNPDQERLPEFVPPIEAWPENPLFKKYPLVLINEHTRWRTHSQWFEVPWLRELDPEPLVYLNPKDAAARGIASGDTVEVYNDRGHVVLKVILTEALKPGVTNIPKGWQRHQFKAGGYQELTHSKMNPMSVNMSFFDVLVDVRKVEGQ